jgi:hypothetical protein
MLRVVVPLPVLPVSPVLFVAALLAVALFAAPAAWAFERGDVCTLKAPIAMTINDRTGRVETTLDAGTDVEVVAVGDEGLLRISNGDTKGSVATRDLEAACAGTLQMCRLNAELIVYERNTSESRNWKIKRGAPVNVLRTGKVWAHVRIESLEAYAKADELNGRCPLERGGSLLAAGEEPVTEEVERGEGPGVLLLPFLVEGAAPLGVADTLSDTFFERLDFYRPDAARLGDDGDRKLESGGWKKHVNARAARARGASLSYVVVAKLAVDPAPAASPTAATLVLSLAIIDAKTGATVKGVRAKPTLKPEDTWADTMLGVLLPLMRQAPGARMPAPPKLPATQPTSTTTTPTTTTAPSPTMANATPAAWPWFGNPWGYVALGGAVAAGVGSGVTGALANADNDAANAAAAVSDDRQALRSQALVKAVASDSLAVVAAVAAVTSVVVFAGRVGLAE